MHAQHFCTILSHLSNRQDAQSGLCVHVLARWLVRRYTWRVGLWSRVYLLFQLLAERESRAFHGFPVDSPRAICHEQVHISTIWHSAHFKIDWRTEKHTSLKLFWGLVRENGNDVSKADSGSISHLFKSDTAFDFPFHNLTLESILSSCFRKNGLIE